MDSSGSNSNYSRNMNMNRHNEYLGVNKIGKSIRKSPLHHPNFTNPRQQLQQQPQPQPQPQVYNISKNDFRSIVQQLTGSPSHHDTPPAPPPASAPRQFNPSKPPSLRLQKIRPPPLTTGVARPPIPPPMPALQNPNPNSPFFSLPGPLSPLLQPVSGGDLPWPNPAESPISAYMRYLQTSIMDPGSRQTPPSQAQGQLAMLGILPTPPVPPVFPSPRGSGPAAPALLPSPIPSPSSFLNLLSPRSPYPLLSPGFQFPPPFTPNFALSPLSQASGILGPGPQLPPSPGILFPSSPSGFLPITSPRWRE